MPQYIPLPDGSFFEIKEGQSPQQAQLEALQKYPEAFGFGATKPAQDTTGFKAAAAAGIERMKGEAALTAAKAGLMDSAEAERIYKAQEEKAKQRFTPTEEGWLEAPWQKLKETAGGSLPYMAAPAVVGGLGALAATGVGAPAAAGIAGAGLAGLAGVGQYTGTNIARQMEQGKTLQETSGAAALGAAIPQAVLDVVSLRMIPGLGRIFGAAGKEVTEETAKAIAQQTLKQAAVDYAKATGKMMGVEGLTEVGQQALERLQAGLSITDPQAREEYFDSFIGGAALAGVISPVGRAAERGQIKREGQRLETARLQEEGRITREAQAEQEAQRKLAEEQQFTGDLFPETLPEGPLKPAEAAVETPPPEAPTEANRRIMLLEQAIEAQQEQMQGATPEQTLVLQPRIQKLREALAKAREEAGVPAQGAGEFKAQLTPLYKQAKATETRMKNAQEQGDEVAAGKYAKKLLELRQQIAALAGPQAKAQEFEAAQEARTAPVQEGLFSDETLAANAAVEQTLADEMAAAREAQAAQRAQEAATAQRVAQEAEGIQRLGKGPEYAGEVRAERKEAAESKRLQQQLTGVQEQRELFPSRAEGVEPVTRTIPVEPSTPKAVQTLLARAKAAPNVDENTRALIDRVDAELAALQTAKATAGERAPLMQTAAFLSRVVRGQDAAPEARALTEQLNRLEAGRRSETERLPSGKVVKATQAALPLEETLAPEQRQKGIEFPTFADLDQFMAGEAVRAIREAQKLSTPTVSRVMAEVAPKQKQLKTLRARLKYSTLNPNQTETLREEVRTLAREIETAIRGLPQLARRAAEGRMPAEKSRVEREAASVERKKAEQARLEQRAAEPRTRVTFEKTPEASIFPEEYIAAVERMYDPELSKEARMTAAKEADKYLEQLLASKEKKAATQAQALKVLTERRAEKLALIKDLKENKPGQKKKLAREEQILANTEASLAALRKATKTIVGEERPVKPAREGEVEAIAATQRQRRATSPVTREVTSAPSQMRTGTPESRAGETRVGTAKRPFESTKVVERDTAISKREQEAANVQAEALRKQMQEANAAAEALRNQTPEQKRKAAEKARKEAEEIAKEQQALAEEVAEDEYDDYDVEILAGPEEDVFLREDNEFYAPPPSTALSAEVEAAARDGRVIDALDGLETKGSTPFVRELAARLKPLLLRTKLAVEKDVKLNGTPVAGKYNASENKAYVDEAALTEETLLHELVHPATLRALYADAADLTTEQLAAREEVQKIFNEVREDKALKDEYGKKNIDEFVAEVMSNPNLRNKLDSTGNLLQRLYRAFLRLIGLPQQTVSEQAVENIYKLFQPSRVMTTGPNVAGVASVMRGVFPATKPASMPGVPSSISDIVNRTVGRSATIGDKIAAFASGLRWRTAIADRWAPGEALVKRGVSQGKIDEVRALQSRIHMRIHEQQTQFIETAALDGVPQLTKQLDGTFLVEGQSGANLRQIASVLANANIGNEQYTERVFTTWLAILRAEKDNIGYDKLNFDKPLTAKEAQELKDFVSSRPEVKKAFDEARSLYKDYNRNLLNLLVDASVMSRDKADELLKGDYVPYYRERGGVVELVVGGSKPVQIGNVIDQPYLKELIGGQENILPFFSGAMQNTSMLMRMALRNLQTKDMAYLLQDLGMTKIHEGDGPAGMRVVHFKQKGKNYWAELDQKAFPEDIPADLMLSGMQGIKTAVPWLVKVMGVPANILRKTITRMPLYALRQTIRDPLHAWLTTGGDFAPIISSYKELGKMVAGKNATEDMLKRAAVISSNVYTGDPQDAAKTLRDVMSGKGAWNSAMAKLDEFALQGDAATRAVLYNTYRKKGMSHAQALLGTLESMNFSRRGTSASLHWLSTMIPFFNAQIQGLDAVYRAAKGDTVFQDKMDVRASLYRRGALITAATIAYALMMEDDEAYKNATPEERAMNWFVRVPGLDEAVRVPIPFELGLVFKTVPEMVVNTAFGDTKAEEAIKALGKQLWMSSPLSIPTGIKGPIELAANYSFFSDQPIESERERNLTADQRYRQNTTELAKILGSTGALSPVQIEHLVRSYTGGMGVLLMSLANPVLRPFGAEADVERPERKLSELPVIGGLFQPNTGRGLVNAAFKDIERYQQAAQTYKSLVVKNPEEARAYADRFAREIALASTGGAFKQQMGEYAALKRQIAGNKDLSAAEKRDRIEQIKQYEIQLSKRMREMASA